MVCVNNPCPEYLPKVGDASPIVGDEGNTSNMNMIATGYSGGARRSRRAARRSRRAARRSRRAARRSMKKGGARRAARKSRRN